MSATNSTKADLEKLLLLEEIRKTAAEATRAEIDLAIAQDQERDRLVRGGATRTLNIFDQIMPPLSDKWVDALEHWRRRDPGAPVVININSPGGSVSDGLAVYDTIQRMRREGSHVTTRGLGMVASMAAVLLQSGDERVMDRRAKMLIHESSQTIRGVLSAGEQEDMAVYTKMVHDDILDIMSERAILSKRQIQNKWKRRDWILTAGEALKLGFVDHVD